MYHTLQNNITKTLLFALTFFVLSCQNFQIKSRQNQNEKQNEETQTSNYDRISPLEHSNSISNPEPTSPAIDDKTAATTIPIQPPLPTSTPPRLAKIGLILGPGSMRTYAEIGVLQSLIKAKMPIDAVVGIEWGALVAAAFSIHGQANDVEWQMMKIKNEDLNKKGLLTSSGPQDISDLQNHFNDIFQQSKIEQSRIPFVCPAFDIVKKQVFWMKKGEFAKALPYCLASPPLFKPFQNNVPAVDLKLAVDYLKSKGINYVILINVIPATNTLLSGSERTNEGFRDQIIWSQWQLNLQKNSNLVNYNIDVPLDKTSIQDATVRRDLIKTGREIGQSAATILATKLGF